MLYFEHLGGASVGQIIDLPDQPFGPGSTGGRRVDVGIDVDQLGVTLGLQLQPKIVQWHDQVQVSQFVGRPFGQPIWIVPEYSRAEYILVRNDREFARNTGRHQGFHAPDAAQIFGTIIRCRLRL
jgi:hypothetical protein